VVSRGQPEDALLTTRYRGAPAGVGACAAVYLVGGFTPALNTAMKEIDLRDMRQLSRSVLDERRTLRVPYLPETDRPVVPPTRRAQPDAHCTSYVNVLHKI
jgi:hypothetical protein